VYSVTDSDGNTVQGAAAVLVGKEWSSKGGYAIYAKDFTKKVSQIKGTKSEAISLAKAKAVWIGNPLDPSFTKSVSVTVAKTGGYKKAAGKYKITFAVSESKSVTKTITATIKGSAAKPKPPAKKPAAKPPAKTAPPTVIKAPENRVVEKPSEPVGVEVTPAAVEPIPPPAPEPEPVPEPVLEPVPEPEEEGAWHLVDLLLAIFSMALGFFLMAFALRRRDEYEYDELAAAAQERAKTWSLVGVPLGIASIAALLLTQDFAGRMAAADAWAILFAAIFGVELLAAVSVTRDGGPEPPDE
jgi:hypothetical protein